MQFQYFVAKDEDTKRVVLIGRFVDGLPELFKNGKWKFDAFLTSIHQDGRLEYVTEAEAMKLIEANKSPQLQVA